MSAVAQREPRVENLTAGFSLVDMLVALTLLAVMAGLMASFVGQFRTVGRIQQDVVARGELDAITAYLERSIGHAMQLNLVGLPPDRRASLQGDPSHIRFVAVARQGTESFGLRETEIFMQESSRTLVQTFRPRRLDPETSETAALSVELATGVDSVRFRYLVREGGKPAWLDEWTGRSGLPSAVRIELTATRNGKTVTADGQALLALSDGGAGKQSEANGL